MKKAKMIAALAAVMCSITSVSAPMPAFAGEAETENRDQVTEQSLVLPEDIAYIWDTLRTFLWDRETNTRALCSPGLPPPRGARRPQRERRG